MRDRTLAAAAFLAALGAAPLLWIAARGQTLFWGDLLYINQPWRALEAQMLAAGRLPLWNPYVYFGMPLAANMQGALFYPGSAPFWVCDFASALALFEAAHAALAAAFALLWLRSLRARLSACIGGAALYSLGGLMIASRQFPDHLAALALLPAALLFSRRPAALALTLCCAFLAGFPPFFAGTLLLIAVMSAIGAPTAAAAWWRRASAGWVLAGLAGLALSGALLGPALELAWHSRRAMGISPSEALDFGLVPRDLIHWISPWFSSARLDPEIGWWKCGFLGLAGTLACLVGLLRGGRRAAALAAWAAAAAWMTLGRSTAASAWAWRHLSPLRFVRYPGNVAYLAWPAFAALAAAGLTAVSRRAPRLALLWAALLAAELSAYGWGPGRTAPRSFFWWKGPLIQSLQERLDGRRYLLSPRAMGQHAGASLADWKERLYGMTNAPYRLRAAANFGEPLVPAASYRFMESLYEAPDAPAAARLFPAGDVGVLLAPPGQAPSGFHDDGVALWQELSPKALPARAYWLPSGAELPAGLAPLPGGARALPSPPDAREDRFEIDAPAGLPAGQVFVSEPFYPGWSACLETPLGAGRVPVSGALLAFEQVPVPAGPWTLHFLYDPVSWRWGLAVNLAASVLLAAWGCARAAALIA